MGKKLMTISDLYDYYVSNNKTCRFSASNDCDRIVVQIPGEMNFESNDATEDLVAVELHACHTGENINGSFISEKSMTAALPSFSNRPILGFIYEDENGEYQFRDHARHIDDEGNLVYDEIPIGIVPESCNARLEYDKEFDKTYVVVNGYIFKDYSRAYEILEREGQCSVSVELSIRELSYDADQKLLIIEDFYFSGVTILGHWEDGTEVKPGMEHSNIQLKDFSANNNSVFSQDNVIVMLEQLMQKVEQLSINQNLRKEGINQMHKEKFNELLAKYNKSSEDVTFEYENLDDDALEQAFAEAFGEEGTPFEENTEQEGAENQNEEFEEGTDDSSEGSENSEDVQLEDETDDTEDESSDDSVESDTNEDFTLNYTVCVNGTKKEFAVSLRDKISALSILVNDTYGQSDDTWYDVDVYEDPEKYVVMHDFWNNKHFKQEYTVKKDVYSLKGDRVPVFMQFLTQDQIDQLDKMKSNYSEMETKLANYESEPSKIAILESEDYAQIKETDQYVELAKRENYFELSEEELTKKLDEMLLAYAKGNHPVSEVRQTGLFTERRLPVGKATRSKSKRYGSLFDAN